MNYSPIADESQVLLEIAKLQVQLDALKNTVTAQTTQIAMLSVSLDQCSRMSSADTVRQTLNSTVKATLDQIKSAGVLELSESWSIGKHPDRPMDFAIYMT